MTSHEVVYFDAAGRAEPIRICLYIAKKDDWTDTRFPGKDWPSVKGTTPLGFVPVLKIDGESHCQSTALLRYAGKLAGWYPKDDVQGLIVDEVMESLNELMSSAPRGIEDEAELIKARQEFQKTKMTAYAGFVEGFIKDKSTISTEGPSIADLMLMGVVSSVIGGVWTGIDTDFFSAFPGIMRVLEATKTNEHVAAYHASKEK